MFGRAAERGKISFLLLLPLACSSAAKLSEREVADANDTGHALAAKNDNERALLSRVETLPNGVSQRVGSAAVVAEAPYPAASGRVCRALQVTEPTHVAIYRLACSDGRGWFFVPDVFGEPDPVEQ